jgi:hypothetical protein
MAPPLLVLITSYAVTVWKHSFNLQQQIIFEASTTTVIIRINVNGLPNTTFCSNKKISKGVTLQVKRNVLNRFDGGERSK